MNEEWPSLEEDLEAEEEEMRPPVIAAGTLLASAAASASAMLERLARASAARWAEEDEEEEEGEGDGWVEEKVELTHSAGRSQNAKARRRKAGEENAGARGGEEGAALTSSAGKSQKAGVARRKAEGRDEGARELRDAGANQQGEVESDEDGAVELRVSKGTKKVRARGRGQAQVARVLATAVLDTFVEQIAEYVRTSTAVEKLVRAQLKRALRELADDPELAQLVRVGVDRYAAELARDESPLEPLIRKEVEAYFARKGGGEERRGGEYAPEDHEQQGRMLEEEGAARTVGEGGIGAENLQDAGNSAARIATEGRDEVGLIGRGKWETAESRGLGWSDGTLGGATGSTGQDVARSAEEGKVAGAEEEGEIPVRRGPRARRERAPERAEGGKKRGRAKRIIVAEGEHSGSSEAGRDRDGG